LRSLWLDGARAAAQIRGLNALLAIGPSSILAAALINVAEPLLATGPLHSGGSGYALLVAAFGVGMAAGSLANSRVGSVVSRLRRRFLAGVALNGLGLVGSAAAPSLAWAMASFALTGASNGLIVGTELRLYQELVGEELLGRIFGLSEMLNNLAFVLAFLTAGAAISLLGVRGLFALGGAVLLALAGVGIAILRPDRPRPRLGALPDLG
jgi:MFS family permease